MNHERAIELVAALRSGEYQQTQKRLRDLRGYCCLGVACDISHVGHWDDADAYFTVDDDYDDNNDVALPLSVQAYYGFRTNEGAIPEHLRPPVKGVEGADIREGNVHTSLAAMNDGGYTFAEVADFIEKNWEVL